jgi:hypothetical protein
LFVSLFLQDKDNENTLLCNVNTRVLVVGDLKFYAQLMGRENMSSSWCMWCTSHPSDWKHHPLPPAETWTMQKIIRHKQRVDRREVKEARDILGIVNDPVWDFIEPENYIYPELHAEIGLVNNVLEHFYGFVDDQVERITQDELTLRNSYIVADVALSVAEQRLSDWKEDIGPQLEFHRVNRVDVNKELRRRDLDPETARGLKLQQQELDTAISAMVKHRKELEADRTLKRQCAAKARSDLKALREKKKKSRHQYWLTWKIFLLSLGYRLQRTMGEN